MLTLRRVIFNVTATTVIYTLSLHDALPISPRALEYAIASARHAQRSPIHGIRAGLGASCPPTRRRDRCRSHQLRLPPLDRKSTRLNSSHLVISYAVFCLKKKNVYRSVGCTI